LFEIKRPAVATGRGTFLIPEGSTGD